MQQPGNGCCAHHQCGCGSPHQVAVVPPVKTACHQVAPVCPKPPSLLPASLLTAKGKKAHSTSHVFEGPENGVLDLSLISLLQQSQTGLIGVHSVDIDVRQTDSGVTLQRGNGVDVIYEGGSRQWQGADDGMGVIHSATEFTLSLLAGDVVVINWTEIKA